MKTTWGYSRKFYRERLRLEVQSLALLYTFWIEKVRIPLSNFVYLLARNPLHIHSLELCISFNCCKCSVSWVKHKTTTFSRLFPSHKMHMFALLDLYFYRPEMTDFPTLSCTYTWSLKKVRTPLRRSHPVQVITGEYSPEGETIDCVYKGWRKGFWSLWRVKMWA